MVYYATFCYLTIRGGRVHVISPLKLRSYIGTCMSRTEKKVCSGGNSKPGTLSIPFFLNIWRDFFGSQTYKFYNVHASKNREHDGLRAHVLSPNEENSIISKSFDGIFVMFKML